MALRNFSQAKAALARVRRTSIRTAAGSLLAGIAAVGVVIGVTMMSGGTALASATPTPSRTDGNIPPGQGNPCIAAGLSGSVLFGGLSPDLSPNPAAGSGTVYDGGTIDGEQDFLDVTINAGYTASGIVVAAGGDQNVYHGPFVGPDTIIGMHGPTNGGGNETPAISHWYVCGDTSPSESPSESSSPSESPSESPSASPSESPECEPEREPK